MAGDGTMLVAARALGLTVRHGNLFWLMRLLYIYRPVIRVHIDTCILESYLSILALMSTAVPSIIPTIITLPLVR